MLSKWLIIQMMATMPSFVKVCNYKSWLHCQCAGLSKRNFDLLHNPEVPFCCPHCFLQRYQSQLSDFKLTITQLQNKVSELETKLLGLSPSDYMNFDTSPCSSLLTNRDKIPEHTRVSLCFSAAVTSIINEEKISES